MYRDGADTHIGGKTINPQRILFAAFTGRTHDHLTCFLLTHPTTTRVVGELGGGSTDNTVGLELTGTLIYRAKPFLPSIPVNRGPSVRVY